MTNPAQATGVEVTAAPVSGARAGLVYGITAYALWGVFPIYFRALSSVSPWVIVCHRILWSAGCLAVLVSILGEWGSIRQVLARRRDVLFLCAGATLIALNWLVFIYSVATHRVLEASLGYFINPLLSVALGMIFLRERLRRFQWVALAIVLAAVLNLSTRGTGFPWIALTLASSFGLYGLVRKKVNINSLHALLVESTLLVPLAVLMLWWLPPSNYTSRDWGLLSLSGAVTATPMIFFGAALRRLRLSTVGFLQYIGPTLQFLVATVIFGETLDHAKIFSFGLCWIGIAVYVVDSVLAHLPQTLADRPE